MQLLKIKCVGWRLITYFVLVKEQRLVIILVVLVIAIILKRAVQLVKDKIEGCLSSHKSLCLWKIRITNDSKRELFTLLQNIIPLNFNLLVIQLFGLEFSDIFIIIQMNKWLKVTIFLILIGINYIISTGVVYHQSRLIVHLTI